ncbi:MAG: GH3 auxin-responsive promoter family protein [Pseudomonadota bacterium]
MLDATPLLRLYARWRNSFLESNSPRDLQRQQLLALVSKAKHTTFGRAHGFESIRSVEEYQARVPIRSYEEFWNEFLKPGFPVLKDAVWPGLISNFAVSSGTSSGTTKYIPCTAEMLASNRKAAFDLLVHHVTNRPDSRILGGKNFLLGGSTDLTNPAPGIHFGDLSGIVAKDVPWWLRSRYFPPLELTQVKNWEEKIDTFARASLSEDIRMISGVPAWMMIFFDKLLQISPNAANGIGQVYRNLEMVVHGGVSFAPYIDRFRDLLADSQAELREDDPASEGFIAIADRGYGDGLRMNLDHGIFYEFVPLAELSNKNPTRHWIGNVETDINYAVVMSTCAGLWSYVIGDTVRFVDTDNPRVLVTGRTSYYLSAFGEHLIGEEIEDGVSAAAKSIELEVSDYSVGPIYPKNSGELGGHIYVVEFTKTPPNSDGIERFAQVLDTTLCKRNEDYEAHRSQGFGLNPPKILPVPAGTFANWMKSRGKLGGQNKVPRIITNAELLEDLLKFAQSCQPNPDQSAAL